MLAKNQTNGGTLKILLIAYDNDSFIHTLPLGLMYVASALRNAGHAIEFYNQDVHHYPCEHLTQHLDSNCYDSIFFSFIGGYYQFRKALEISAAINSSKQRKNFSYVIGGHGPSPEPEYFLKKIQADVVCVGEGEETAVELLRVLENKGSLSEVDGIAYRVGDKVAVNKRRKLIKDVDSIALPSYDAVPMQYYRLIRETLTTAKDFVGTMISGRGCKWQCNFCYRMDKGFRPRSNAGIIEEIKLLKRNYGINYIQFNDELLMSSPERTMSLCEDFIREDLQIHFSCNGRLNYATPEVMRAMKKAGAVFVNYGIECFDDEELKVMGKHLTTEQITKGIEATLAAGISPGYNIIFGNVGESKEMLEKGVQFLLKYDDGSQLRLIRNVTPYPGSALYYYAIEKGLLKDCADFYENKHLNSDLLSANFTNISDEEVYKALFEANSRLLDNYYAKKRQEAQQTLEQLYIGKNSEFRGWRTV